MLLNDSDLIEMRFNDGLKGMIEEISFSSFQLCNQDLNQQNKKINGDQDSYDFPQDPRIDQLDYR